MVHLLIKVKKRYANASQKIMNASLYTERQVNELPRKERKATKRHLKEYHQSYVKEAKNQYKKFGKSRGLKKIDYDQKAKAYINSKTGKKSKRGRLRTCRAVQKYI